MEPKADIAVIGLAVMGQNLILNMNDHGFTVAAFNRTVSKVDDFLNKEAKGTQVIGAHSLEEMVSLLKRPRRVMLMVKAGQAVDEFIEHLLPLLEGGDIIIGDADIKAQVPANAAVMDFQWTSGVAAQNNLNFNDVQIGLRIFFSL